VLAARHELDRRRPRARAGHGIEDVCGVAAILGPVGRIDLIGDGPVGVPEGDVPVDAAGFDVAFVT
jgi:hypothetical protein